MASRREFIKRISVGFASVFVPLKINKQESDTAIKFLYKIYAEYCKGLTGRYTPKSMAVSQALYDKYESELVANQRFMSGDKYGIGYDAGLAFKSLTVRVNPKYKRLEYSIA